MDQPHLMQNLPSAKAARSILTLKAELDMTFILVLYHNLFLEAVVVVVNSQ